MIRMSAKVALLCLSAMLPGMSRAQAAEAPPQYVVVSAIGQGFTIVRKRVDAGGHMGGVSRDAYPFSDATFDDAILDAAERTVRQAQPVDAPRVVRARVSGMLVDDRAYEVDPIAVARLIDAVRPNVADAKHARLIVVTPVRAPIQVSVEVGALGPAGPQGHTGEAAEAGLGYYLDGETMIWDRRHHENNQGYLAVFANIQLLLIDFDSRTVIAREISSEAEMYTASRRKASQPWDALTSTEKVAVMRNLVAAKVRKHLPALLHAEK